MHELANLDTPVKFRAPRPTLSQEEMSMLILAFLMFLTGGGLILTAVIGGIAILFGVTSVPFTGLVAIAMFITGGCLEAVAAVIFFRRGPSAMMGSMEKALDMSGKRNGLF